MDEPSDDATGVEIDLEIEALLEFEPVPRKVKVAGAWTDELQRELIARLAVHGSPNKACEEMGKSRAGTNKLLRSPHGASFRAAWDGAVALAKRRKAEEAPEAEFVGAGFVVPSLDHRRKTNPHHAGNGSSPNGPGFRHPLPHAGEGAPGQVLNEYGEYEDEASLQDRADDARDSVAGKLLRARRLYLMEISGHPASRAAFELLTNYPIDWDKAARAEPQDDEPWRRPNMRKPDMLLTAESGWLGNVVHGPDKQAELMRAINDWRAEQGLEAVTWDAENDSPPPDGEGPGVG